jgi:hypothetical protein
VLSRGKDHDIAVFIPHGQGLSSVNHVGIGALKYLEAGRLGIARAHAVHHVRYDRSCHDLISEGSLCSGLGIGAIIVIAPTVSGQGSLVEEGQ